MPNNKNYIILITGGVMQMIVIRRPNSLYCPTFNESLPIKTHQINNSEKIKPISISKKKKRAIAINSGQNTQPRYIKLITGINKHIKQGQLHLEKKKKEPISTKRFQSKILKDKSIKSVSKHLNKILYATEQLKLESIQRICFSKCIK